MKCEYRLKAYLLFAKKQNLTFALLIMQCASALLLEHVSKSVFGRRCATCDTRLSSSSGTWDAVSSLVGSRYTTLVVSIDKVSETKTFLGFTTINHDLQRIDVFRLMYSNIQFGCPDYERPKSIK